jgi:hypothetical protein
MLHRLHSLLLASLLALSPELSFASQNQLSSPTVGTVSGLQLTNSYNNALDSVNTCNSGPSAPTNQLTNVASLGNCWLNTTGSPDPLQWYDGAQWLKAGYIDTANHLWNAVVGGGTATIASTATTDPCSNSANYLTISGTTTITSFGSGCETGQEKTVTFSGILTLTYNATSLIIPGAASVTTAAGDIAKLRYLGSSNWQVEAYLPATGQALVNPSIPVGSVIAYSGITAPANFQLGYGQAITRASFPNYLAAVTSTQSVTRTNTSPTVTGFSDTSNFGYGQVIEMSGFTTGTTILSCTATTCRMSANASSSGTSNLTVFLYGYGAGGSTSTVGLPNCNGRAMVFRDNQGGSAANVSQVATNITTSNTSTAATVSSATGLAWGMAISSLNVAAGTTISFINGTAVTLSSPAIGSGTNVAARFSALGDAQALGSAGGGITQQLFGVELPTTTPTFTASNSYTPGTLNTNANTVTASGTAGVAGSLGELGGTTQLLTVALPSYTPTGTISGFGNNQVHSIANPGLVLNCIVRVSHLIESMPVFAANDNGLAIIDRRRVG